MKRQGRVLAISVTLRYHQSDIHNYLTLLLAVRVEESLNISHNSLKLKWYFRFYVRSRIQAVFLI